MNRPTPVVVRLIGPSLAEVARFVAGLPGEGGQAIAWDVAPEVHVKCPDPARAEAVIARYGADAYSVSGQPMEAVVGGALAAAGLTLATAESCTGGLVGHLVTGVPGSSAYYFGGVVAYSNAAKERLLGVPGDVIAAHGAVSREVVTAMAEGTARTFGASLGVAVSGVAGPGGGSEAKPVGTVWIGVAGGRGTRASLLQLKGTRAAIKHAAAIHALDAVRREVLGLPGRGGGAERGTGGT